MIITLVSIIAGLVALIYLYYAWKFSYWNKKKFPHVKPSFPFGNLGDTVLQKKTIGEIHQEIYRKLDGEPLGGFYNFSEPTIMIRDEELIKTILVKDFNSFHDNEFNVNEKLDPLMAYNPFVVKGDKWKQIRNLHTGSFTTSKLKAMVPLTVDVCKNLIKHIEQKENVAIEAKNLCATYATDNVASCGFGLVTSSLLNPEDGFANVTRRVFETNTQTAIAVIIVLFLPGLANYNRVVNKDLSDYFLQIIKDTIHYRESKGVKREDFLQHMMTVLKERKEYDYTVITSQCFGMLTDGFFTTSIAMSWVLYELATHPEIQEKLRDSIKSVGSDISDFDYDKIQSCTYLDMVVNESLRLHPPLTQLLKKCTKTTTLSHNGKDYKIEKGLTVVIPSYAVHRDERFYPNPTEFIPERFSEQEKSKRDRYTFLSFGEGPRICVGMRFAILQIKLGVATILLNFNVKARDRPPLKLDPKNPAFHTAQPGIWLYFEKLKS